MPMKPARVCLHPGCGRLVQGQSRCEEHRLHHQRGVDAARGNSTARGYGSRWRKLSASIVARDGGICFYCGLPGATTADHRTPKRLGGSDDPSNLVAAHVRCNSAKGGR